MLKAVQSKLGNDAEEVLKELSKSGINRTLANLLVRCRVILVLGFGS